MKAKRALKMCLFAVLGLPVCSAGAGALLGPFVLHPFRHVVTGAQSAEADRDFTQIGAARDDLVVHTFDGTSLRGWKVRPTRGNGEWVILLHGRSHNRFVMLKYAEFLLAAGYGVVMMDARAHGSSGGTMATYGHLEVYDTRAIVDALESSERVSHLYALGESMGAAVALQSAAIEPRIQGVVAEGAFCNLREVTFDYAGLQWSESLGKTVFRPTAIVAVFVAEHEGHFHFADVSPEASVARRPFPVLLICGLQDHKIPRRHSDAIFAAATGPRQLWLAPGAGHEKAIVVAPGEFKSRVLGFFASASTFE